MFIRSSLSEMHGYVALSHRKYIHSFTCHCALISQRLTMTTWEMRMWDMQECHSVGKVRG